MENVRTWVRRQRCGWAVNEGLTATENTLPAPQGREWARRKVRRGPGQLDGTGELPV